MTSTDGRFSTNLAGLWERLANTLPNKIQKASFNLKILRYSVISVTNNDQYEDSFGEFTLNDPPSGEELYKTITCYLYGLATGYFRVLKEF